MDSCLLCMVCVSACPAVEERAFDGPAFMLKLRHMAKHPADTRNRLAQALEGGMLECFNCDVCTQVCPADLSPAQAIREFRKELIFGGQTAGRREARMSQGLTLPRNTTQQAEKPLHGNIARWLHRITGTVIVVFVLVHVIAQSVLHVPALASAKAATPWLPVAQSQHWVHALLYFSIAFHTLYGLKLLVTECGFRIEYRTALWSIVAVSALLGLREVLRYAGI